VYSSPLQRGTDFNWDLDHEKGKRGGGRIAVQVVRFARGERRKRGERVGCLEGGGGLAREKDVVGPWKRRGRRSRTTAMSG